MKRLFSIVIIALIFSFLPLCLVACDGKTEQEVGVDYGKDNAFEFEVAEDDDSVAYTPIGVKAKYGLLFYVGTAIAPENYSYLAEPLAKQGYAVVISKIPLAYMLYRETEPAFEKYPDIEFFIGGHSQGGGAAVKRAQENLDFVKGVILYAPLCFGNDTIEESLLPTLLIEATKDGVLSKSMKADAKTRLPNDRTEYMIEGCHMSFSSMDSDFTLGLFNDGPATDEVKAAQKAATFEYTLAFLRAVIQGDTAQ